MTPRVKAIGSHNSLWGRGQEQGLGWPPIVRLLHTPHPRTNELSTPPACAGVSSQLGRPVLPGGFQGRLKCECQMRRCSPQLHPRRGDRWPGRRDGDHSSLPLRGGHSDLGFFWWGFYHRPPLSVGSKTMSVPKLGGVMRILSLSGHVGTRQQRPLGAAPWSLCTLTPSTPQAVCPPLPAQTAEHLLSSP